MIAYDNDHLLAPWEPDEGWTNVGCETIRVMLGHARYRLSTPRNERGLALLSAMGKRLNNPSCECGRCGELLSQAKAQGGDYPPCEFLTCLQALNLQEEMEDAERDEDDDGVRMIDTRLRTSYVIHRCGRTWKTCPYWNGDPGDGWEIDNPVDLVLNGIDMLKRRTADLVVFHTMSGSAYTVRRGQLPPNLAVTRTANRSRSVFYPATITKIYGTALMIDDTVTTSVMSARVE